jgi:LPXTG-motif cell wall-anchored protein
VSVNQPDIAVVLTPDSGGDQLGFLGTGQDLILAVDVANLGYGTPRSSLVIDLPAGAVLGADGVTRESDGTSLTCQPGATPQRIACDLGNLSHAGSGSPTLDIDLTTSGTEAIGQLATITVSASPNAGEGTDTAPANDSVTAQFQFTGSARLSYTITPAKTKVALGQQTSVKLTVHNAGPQPANETVAFGVLVGTNFDITSFTGNTTPPPSLTGGASTSAIPPTMNGVFWFVGDIPAGHSVSAVLNIRARTVGTTRVGLMAISTAADLNCPNLNCDLTSVPVQAIGAPVVPASAPTRTSPIPAVASSKPLQLANTGAASTPALGLGGLLLALGVALTYTSRRRSQ